MKFTFAAALFAASGAAAAPVEVHSSPKFLPFAVGHLRGDNNLDVFARRLYPDEYDSRGCLGDNFKDKCANCMCLDGNTKHCDLSATPDGEDHCVDNGANGSNCSHNWECQSNNCMYLRGICVLT